MKPNELPRSKLTGYPQLTTKMETQQAAGNLPAEIKIPWAKPAFTGNESIYLQQALASSWVSGGEFVDRFEDALCRMHGGCYGMTTSSGTSALHLALLALGIGEADEVIVPGFTFAAAANIGQLINLHKFFYILVKCPWIKPLVRCLIRFPPNKIFEGVFIVSFGWMQMTCFNRNPLQLMRMGLGNLKVFYGRKRKAKGPIGCIKIAS